jgi:hypothetical protein
VEEECDRFKTGFIEAAEEVCGQNKWKEKVQGNTLVDGQNKGRW